MPTFEIEQYELYIKTFTIEATSKAEAIANFLNGEGDPVEESQEFIEVAEIYGMPVDEHRDLANEVRKLGVVIGEDVIPSIRTIEEIE